eukprot:396826-Rhodomonas_salina.2
MIRTATAILSASASTIGPPPPFLVSVPPQIESSPPFSASVRAKMGCGGRGAGADLDKVDRTPRMEAPGSTVPEVSTDHRVAGA